MLNRETAKLLVTEYINTYNYKPDNPLIVMDEHTITKEYGWVFFYNSRKFLETGDLNEALGGNAPIIVDKEDGALYVTGTAEATEVYIKRFEAQRRSPLRRLIKWVQSKRSPQQKPS